MAWAYTITISSLPVGVAECSMSNPNREKAQRAWWRSAMRWENRRKSQLVLMVRPREPRRRDKQAENRCDAFRGLSEDRPRPGVPPF
jgi:hypothetical protein